MDDDEAAWRKYWRGKRGRACDATDAYSIDRLHWRVCEYPERPLNNRAQTGPGCPRCGPAFCANAAAHPDVQVDIDVDPEDWLGWLENGTYTAGELLRELAAHGDWNAIAVVREMDAR